MASSLCISSVRAIVTAYGLKKTLLTLQFQKACKAHLFAAAQLSNASPRDRVWARQRSLSCWLVSYHLHFDAERQNYLALITGSSEILITSSFPLNKAQILVSLYHSLRLLINNPGNKGSQWTCMSIIRHSQGKDCIPSWMLSPPEGTPWATPGDLLLYWCPKAHITPANGKLKPLSFLVRQFWQWKWALFTWSAGVN